MPAWAIKLKVEPWEVLLVVVFGIPAHHLGRVLVTETLQEPFELVLGEEEEEQHGVGLLGQLVPVRVVPLGAQDTVETLDVAVLLTVVVPVEFLEVLVALELADKPVAMERHEHLAAHLIPHLDLFVGKADPGTQRLTTTLGEQIQHLEGDLGEPGDHHVGVGVVPQALFV